MTNADDPQEQSQGTGQGRIQKFRNQWQLFLFALTRIRETRKWWLLPVLLLLVIFGLFLNLFTGYNILPAIYGFVP